MKYSMEFTAQRHCCVKMLDRGDKGDKKPLLHAVYWSDFANISDQTAVFSTASLQRTFTRHDVYTCGSEASAHTGVTVDTPCLILNVTRAGFDVTGNTCAPEHRGNTAANVP